MSATLTQTGNWSSDQLDLNGDTDFLDTDELDDARSHNVVNEITARDIDNDSSDDYTLAYDAAGNMTDDGEAYKYEWDAFYRLRRVRNQSNQLVAEYWYNGLGYLITRHQDTDKDGDVDGSDVKFHTAYDERWRQVATFRGSDGDPKEQFVYHAAGGGGFGGSSYIDSVLLRDRDMTNGWTGSADGTLEERIYLLQNWRADVVAIVEPDGGGAIMKEWVKYSAYGVPFALPAGDTDSDGDCDSTDDSQVTTWKNAPAYDVRGDLDLDGDVDAADETLVAGAHQALGRGVLSSSALSSGVGNRKGYAGYEGDAKLSAKWHVRRRVLDSVLGRWLRRDPLGHIDGPSTYGLVRTNPITLADSTGLSAIGGGLGGVAEGFVVSAGSSGGGSDYCELVRMYLDARGFSPMAVTFCADGKAQSCVWSDRIREQNHRPDIALPYTIDMITECIERHEQDHRENLDCPPPIHVPGAIGFPSSPAMEVSGYSIEIGCLKAASMALARTQDYVQQSVVNTALDNACEYYAANAAQAGVSQDHKACQ